ncbi:MAG: hypothetical protein M0R48_07315 [Candidatus Omnitrophica bacterium]|jgi:hypothetical protein|nr:hypothetical protein [Candidatus Omnitrophota bacterium]
MNVYFSDIFDVKPKTIEKYGAFNVSLINDLPLFIDPFLLFNSDKKEYQKLHEDILKYVAFLRDRSISIEVSDGLLRSWYCFPEVKQTWLGYSEIGNAGRGPGIEFAKSLDNNLSNIFADFDKNKISRSAHLEKLCLIRENTGRDNISDFVTNLIKGYLLSYTQDFARKYIDVSRLKEFNVSRVVFNYKTSSWVSSKHMLPCFDNDFVLLTPRDLLTKDDTWINKPDLINQFDNIVLSVSNDQLRSQLNFYFSQNLPKPEYTKKGKEKKPAKKDIAKAINAVMQKYPVLLDYYIKYKEDQGDNAVSISAERVEEVYSLFVEKLSLFISYLFSKTDFYKSSGNTLRESYQRVMFLKHVIEDQDGYKIFYPTPDGKPINRESYLHIMFKLTWCASESAITPETNAGRGPVDFAISKGARDKTLVEFKLASSSKLRQNLLNQVEIYKKAHDTNKAIKVILFFSAEEESRAKGIIGDLGLLNEKYIVLIDARRDNKVSASKAK